MITDDDIRAALHRIASRAPDPPRVQAGLAARSAAHRQRRALLVAGGALAAAAAIGLPVAVLAGRRPIPFLGPGPDDVPIAPDVPTRPNLEPVRPEPAAVAPNRRVQMRYRPTWLPEGYVEHVRTASIAGGEADYQLRQWMRPVDVVQPPDKFSEGPPFVRLMLVAAEDLPIGDWLIPVTVNGVHGGLSPKEGQIPQVVWPAGDGLNLAVMVSGVGDDSLVAQWIARSVEPDGVAGVEVALHFGWLPESLQGEQHASVSSSVDTWVARLSGLRGRVEVIRAELGPRVEPVTADGNPAMVRGRPGQLHMFPAGGGWTHVELDDRLRLAVLAESGTAADPADPAPPGAPVRGISREDLLRITDELIVGVPPYVDWLGTR